MMPKTFLTTFFLCASLAANAPGAYALEWALNKQLSRIGFEIVSPEGSLAGSFEQFEAEIRFDPEFPDMTDIRARVDMYTVTTGNAQIDDALRSAAWFDTQTYPAAGFRARSLAPGADGAGYTLQGDLTIRGISHPVSLPVTYSIDQGDARVTGELAINRQAFGVGAESDLAGRTPGDVVIIRLDIVATRLDN